MYKYHIRVGVKAQKERAHGGSKCRLNAHCTPDTSTAHFVLRSLVYARTLPGWIMFRVRVRDRDRGSLSIVYVPGWLIQAS